MTPTPHAWRAAKLALLLSPALLAACYVVPIAPRPYPVYRQYPAPHPYYQDRQYRPAPRYRGPYGEAPAEQSFAAATDVPDTSAAASFEAQSASPSIER
jgi:hypothetical protein